MIFSANPGYLDVNFDFPYTEVFLLVFLSLETLPPKMQFLAFELKTWKISLRNLTCCLNAVISHTKTKYEETSFIKVLKLYIMRWFLPLLKLMLSLAYEYQT